MQGRIEVIAGPMFSGKSEELVRRLRRQAIARRRVVAFHSTIDTRGTPGLIESRAGVSFAALVVRDSAQLVRLAAGYSVVGIDEAQFFEADIVPAVVGLADAGVLVIVAGLDRFAGGRPWPPMPELMAVADHVEKLAAVCVACGESAMHTHAKAGGGDRVEIGSEQYEARCRACMSRG